MKKLVSCLLALCMLLSAAGIAYASDEGRAQYSAASFSGEIIIDGVMDEAYQNAAVVPMNSKIMASANYEESQIADGEMRILWSETAIYLFITVNDATYAPPYANPGWFNNTDSVWFAVGVNDDLSQTNCYAVARAGDQFNKMNAASPDIVFAVRNLKDGQDVAMTDYGNADGNYPADCPCPDGEVDGYVIEAMIPCENPEGKPLYFGAFICDDVDFTSTDVINYSDGRSRTSPVVSTASDNGIWNTSSGDFDARAYFDLLLPEPSDHAEFHISQNKRTVWPGEIAYFTVTLLGQKFLEEPVTLEFTGSYVWDGVTYSIKPIELTFTPDGETSQSVYWRADVDYGTPVYFLCEEYGLGIQYFAHYEPEENKPNDDDDLEFPRQSYSAARRSGAVELDGVMDEAYLEAPVVPLGTKQLLSDAVDEDALADGEMRILWDDNAIYLYITINDATYAPPYANAGWFNNVDSVWFAVGANENQSLVDCYAVARAGENYNKFSGASPDIEFAVVNMNGGEAVAMETYGNAAGNYPADSLKPVGDVDSYVIEVRIPHANAGAEQLYFGAFICDDVDFAGVDVINLTEGRARTSEAVSTPNDNGIWNTTGGAVTDARDFFDKLTLTPGEGPNDEPGGDQPGGDQPGGDQPGGDQPGGDQPGGDQPGGDQPGGDDSGDDDGVLRYSASKATDGIEIDGVMEDSYQRATSVAISNKQLMNNNYSEDDLADGEMRLLWDEEAIYVYITVNDGTYAPPYAEASWWDNVDSVWFAVTDENFSRVDCYAVPRAGANYRKLNGGSPDIEFNVKNMNGGEEAAMISYGNDAGNYPANTLHPDGDVDSYVIEVRIPYQGSADQKLYFGAFICDDTDFANVDVINLTEGRTRTSEGVSNGDTGIWNGTTSDSFDELTLSPEEIAMLRMMRMIPNADSEEGQTEEGQTEEGQTEEGQTEEGQTEEGQTEEGQTEEGQTEEGQTEEGQTEEGQTEEGQTEEGQTEEGQTEEGQTEEGQTEEGNQE